MLPLGERTVDKSVVYIDTYHSPTKATIWNEKESYLKQDYSFSKEDNSLHDMNVNELPLNEEITLYDDGYRVLSEQGSSQLRRAVQELDKVGRKLQNKLRVDSWSDPFEKENTRNSKELEKNETNNIVEETEIMMISPVQQGWVWIDTKISEKLNVVGTENKKSILETLGNNDVSGTLVQPPPPVDPSLEIVLPESRSPSPSRPSPSPLLRPDLPTSRLELEDLESSPTNEDPPVLKVPSPIANMFLIVSEEMKQPIDVEKKAEEDTCNQPMLVENILEDVSPAMVYELEVDDIEEQSAITEDISDITNSPPLSQEAIETETIPTFPSTSVSISHSSTSVCPSEICEISTQTVDICETSTQTVVLDELDNEITSDDDTTFKVACKDTPSSTDTGMESTNAIGSEWPASTATHERPPIRIDSYASTHALPLLLTESLVTLSPPMSLSSFDTNTLGSMNTYDGVQGMEDTPPQSCTVTDFLSQPSVVDTSIVPEYIRREPITMLADDQFYSTSSTISSTSKSQGIVPRSHASIVTARAGRTTSTPVSAASPASSVLSPLRSTRHESGSLIPSTHTSTAWSRRQRYGDAETERVARIMQGSLDFWRREDSSDEDGW